MRIERREGPTPSGGSYSEAIFDEDGRVVEIAEYDASGESTGETPVVPVTTLDLLRLLDVESLSVEEQRRAVDTWLTRNTPSPLLLASLHQDGLTLPPPPRTRVPS